MAIEKRVALSYIADAADFRHVHTWSHHGHAEDLSSLDLAIRGGTPMPVEFWNRFERATGIRILEACECVESACVAALDPVEGERRVGREAVATGRHLRKL